MDYPTQFTTTSLVDYQPIYNGGVERRITNNSVGWVSQSRGCLSQADKGRLPRHSHQSRRWRGMIVFSNLEPTRPEPSVVLVEAEVRAKAKK